MYNFSIILWHLLPRSLLRISKPSDDILLRALMDVDIIIIILYGRGKGSLCCCCSRATAFVGLRFGRVGGNRRLLCHARPLTQKGGDGPCI